MHVLPVALRLNWVPFCSNLEALSRRILLYLSLHLRQVTNPQPSMSLPSFDGTDAIGWLTRASQYFMVNKTPTAKRLDLALIALSCPALPWVQILMRRYPSLSWDQFGHELLVRFGDNNARDGYEALATTKHVGSLSDYIAAFESHLAQLPDLTDCQLPRGILLSPLHPLCQGACGRPIVFAPCHKRNIRNILQLVHVFDVDSSTALPTVVHPKLCRSSSHTNDDGQNDNNEEGALPSGNGSLLHLQLSELSSNGLDSCHAMKLSGSINTSNVTVMVDSGASDCFITDHVAARLGLVISSTAIFSVRLGDGTKVRSGRLVHLQGDPTLTRRACTPSEIRSIEATDDFWLLWSLDADQTTTAFGFAETLPVASKHQLQVLIEAFPAVEYLGHIVSFQGVQMDPTKISAVLRWPTPSTMRGVRGFLGLTGELMDLVLAIQHWRPYLLGHRFVVRTDQRSLRHSLTQPLTTPAQKNWAAKLLGFDFSVVYKGALNQAADALSRQEEDIICAAISTPIWLDWSAVQSSIDQDAHLSAVRSALREGKPSSKQYTLTHDLLFYKGRLDLLRVDPPYLPEQVLDRRSIERDNASVDQVLVLWAGMPKEDATRVDVVDMQGQFPFFSLTDKAVSTEEAIDIARPWKLYTQLDRKDKD
ncbi:hypothetical protein SASPL_127009 [Salvia splendens]|uniref:Reverse transcriptase RNase H-like domain-containing protein n=1 Tax=Salvia splendens TaxID=180675 RepID=A0A8X8XHZ7_SALSN|nr:hypothetical protein SASPL_127009 [Salvia splendens]